MFIGKIKTLILCLFLLNYYVVAQDFVFPENTTIYYSDDRQVDISYIKLDIRPMLRGGIGYGADASLLLAHGMKAIGSNEEVYNAPFALYRRSILGDKNYQLRNDDPHSSGFIASIGEFNAGIKLMNLPLDIDGHASLATIKFNNNTIEEIIFFDSLKDQYIKYNERYHDDLVKVITKLISNSDVIPSYRVVHALNQGDENSNGCGYYALFTAMLLKENPHLIKHNGSLLYDDSHDHLIRASLALISFMHDGIWTSKNLRYDDTKAKTKIYHMLEKSEYDIANLIWPKWYRIIGHENYMELWIKYNDLVIAKWSELIISSSLYQHALALPFSEYRIRLKLGEDITRLSLAILNKEIVNKFSQDYISKWQQWLDEHNYHYDLSMLDHQQEKDMRSALGI